MLCPSKTQWLLNRGPTCRGWGMETRSVNMHKTKRIQKNYVRILTISPCGKSRCKSKTRWDKQTDRHKYIISCMFIYIYTHITRAFQTLHHRCIYKAAFIAKKTLLANCIQPNQSQCRPCRLVSKPSKLAQHLNNSCMLIIFVFLGLTSSKDHTA